MSLIYFFDIGNTRGKFWRCVNDRVESKSVIAHGGKVEAVLSQLPDEFQAPPDFLCGMIVLDNDQEQLLRALCEHKWRISPVLARSQRQSHGVVNGYDSPEQLGVDRWLDLIAIGSKDTAACIVSCGTALTIDVLKKGVHCGGYILPGLAMAARAVRAQTSRVHYDADAEWGVALGHNTAEAVSHGALATAVSVIERVVAEHKVSRVILTGGDADKVSPFLSCPHTVDGDLLLRGLRQYFFEAE